MANLPLTHLVLDDRWPGTPNIFYGRPTNGWDNTVDNFKTSSGNTTPKYPAGTKIQSYTDNSYCPGWYTMMYLSFHDYSAVDISGDFSDGNFWCSHYDGSDAEKYSTDFSSSPYYVVARCYTAASTDVTKGAPVAVPCFSLASDGSGAYVAGYGDAYGWFWVGGVCPCLDATIMKGLADSDAGADVTVKITRRGPLYPDISGATMVWRSHGDLTDADAEVNPPIGWICTTGD